MANMFVEFRGTLLSLNTLLVTGGQFFATVFAALLSSYPQGWRYMLGLAAIPACLQFIGFIFLPGIYYDICLKFKSMTIVIIYLCAY